MKLYHLLTALLLTCGTVHAASPQKREMRMARMQQTFANPGKEYRTAPLWVWNTDVRRTDIDRMLAELKDQGFGGAFIHPRPGLETEYLSPEWFDLWTYSLDKGKELGLDIWIYDENSYPSGFAGGHVPDQMPESYNQGQALIGQRTPNPPAAGDCYLCLKREGDTFRDVTARLADYQGKTGDYYVYRLACNGPSTWTAGFPYVDLLAEGVTEKFIDITMRQGYEKHLGKRLGTEVKGTFTDEPNIACPSGRDCRWTPDLFRVFEEMWGYDLRTHWPQLGEEVGDWKKVRHDYNATLLHLFIDRWARPWYDYCESRGISFTGHYWEHNWPDLSQGPDNMAMYAWHQMPAIDMLFNQYDDNANCQAQFGNVRSVKELRSVANQMGYTRTVSETYGGGGWDERFVDFKRLGDWEYALGVNFMNQHLSHMTITGARKFDYPPVFTSISPWWHNYGDLNTYFARLSALLSQGEQRYDWLVIEPTTSLWLHYTQVAGGDPLWQIARSFQSMVTTLEKQQMEYDLGSEDIIMRQGSVAHGGLVIGQRTYRNVVIPPFTDNIEKRTFELLRLLADKGGRIISFAVPTRLDGAESEEVRAFFSSDKVLRLDNAEQLLALYRKESRSQVIPENGQHVYHYRNTYADGELLFVVNSSLDESARIRFMLPGKYLYKLDAMTGRIYLAEGAGKEQHIMLPPAGSAIYFASRKAVLQASATVPLEQPLLHTVQAETPVDIHRVRPNAMTLDFCSLNVCGKQHDNVFHKVANDRLWEHFGQRDPWETAVQFRHDVLDRDTFSLGEVKVSYPFFVTDDFDWSNLTATVEKPWMWQVCVNGQTIATYREDDVIDHRCGVYDIGKAVRRGANSIELTMPRMNIRAEVAPVILQGNFSTIEAPVGFTLSKPASALKLGNYAQQGCHFYPWEMAYTKRYSIQDANRPYQVKLDKWTGTVAEVWVNGQKAGTIAYPPYILDVTGKLQEGRNDVEVRVIGSLVNLYGPHYSQTNGLMGPGHWNGVKQQLPGARYNVHPYGLEDDFQLCY